MGIFSRKAQCMAQAWFLYIDNVVTGPFSTDQVKSKIREEELKAKCFIWWKGQREWVSFASWERDLESILEASSSMDKRPIWYVDTGASSPAGPLTQNEMIDILRATHDLDQVRLWAVGMKKWQRVFELHDVLEILGISRRETDRAPLMGSVAIKRSNDDPRGFVVRAASISVTGMGLAEAGDLRRGDQLSLLIKSHDLPEAIHVHGEVVYVTPTGYAGVRFHKAPSEVVSMLYDYIKRFMTHTSEKKSAA